MPATADPPARDKNLRLPGARINHGVWLSLRFLLRNRDVPALLFTRSVAVSQEVIRPRRVKWVCDRKTHG